MISPGEDRRDCRSNADARNSKPVERRSARGSNSTRIGHGWCTPFHSTRTRAYVVQVGGGGWLEPETVGLGADVGPPGRLVAATGAKRHNLGRIRDAIDSPDAITSNGFVVWCSFGGPSLNRDLNGRDGAHFLGSRQLDHEAVGGSTTVSGRSDALGAFFW